MKSDLGTTGNLWHSFVFGAVALYVKRRNDHVFWGVTMSEEVQSEPIPIRTTSSMRRAGIYAGLLLVVFLLGFVPMWLKSREYSSRLSAVEHRLGIALIENTLASAVIDARRGDYESARQAASLFFNSLRAETDKGNDSALSQTQREGMRSLFVPRDEIITLLARSEAASADRLSDLYVSYRRIMKR